MRIYIAGPYTIGDPILNVRAALEAAEEILEKGHIPFVPHLSMLWHFIFPKKLNEWYAYDLNWLNACDAVLRIPGESLGADREVEHARKTGMKVFTKLEEIANVATDHPSG